MGLFCPVLGEVMVFCAIVLTGHFLEAGVLGIIYRFLKNDINEGERMTFLFICFYLLAFFSI